MGNRDNLGADSSRPGFPIYKPKHLDKINSMRVAKSQPDFHGVPILHPSQVMYVTAAELGGKPASCYTCTMHNEGGKRGSCMLMGPKIIIEKLESEGIEYWPCCGMHEYGEPNKGKPEYHSEDSPDSLGLIWINAPETGLKFGGANCGGGEGGDDCDHYMVQQGEKWSNPTGFCRVMQREVENGGACVAWWDDDILEWQEAQTILSGGEPQTDGRDPERETLGDAEKHELARDIIGRSDRDYKVNKPKEGSASENK